MAEAMDCAAADAFPLACIVQRKGQDIPLNKMTHSHFPKPVQVPGVLFKAWPGHAEGERPDNSKGNVSFIAFPCSTQGTQPGCPYT